MNHPKVQMLIDMGTNKLKQALGKAKSMVDTGVAGIKDKLKSIELPTIKSNKFKSSVNNAYNHLKERFSRPIDAPGLDTGRLQSSLSGIKSMVIGAIGLTAITAGIGSAIQAGLEGSAQKVSFQTMGGDLKGGKLYDDITKFAQDSIFGNELYQNAQTMLAFGLSVDDVLPKMKMLGDVSMGNKEKLSSLTLAYSQIMATGRLMGQDLLQLVNAGFNPLQIISEKTGIGMADLKEKMEKGAIGADLVTKAFQVATSAGGRFFNMTERIAATEFGQWEAMKGQIQGIALQFGTALLPALGQLMSVGVPLLEQFSGLLMVLAPTFSAVIAAAMPLLQVLSSLIGFVKEHITGFNLLVVAYVSGTLALKGLALTMSIVNGIMKVGAVLSGLWTVLTTEMTLAQLGLNAAMLANPLSLVIALVGAAVGAIIYAYKHFEGFRAGVDATWAAIKQFGKVLYELTIGHVMNLVAGLAGLGKAIYLLFTGDFKKAAEEGKNALLNLSGANTIAKAYDQGAQIGAATAKGYNESLKESLDNRIGLSLSKTTGVRSVSTLDILRDKMLQGKKSDGNLNPDKVDQDGKDKDSWKFSAGKDGKGKGNSSDRITGSAQSSKNITVNFGSYIKGDVISQNQQISNMSSDQLDKWLREHFQRLLHSIDAAY